MCVLKHCCCCVDLRIGSIVIAILGVVEGIGAFLNAYGYGLIHLDQIDTNGFITMQNIVMCVAGAIRIIAGLCLLFGSIKYHQPTTLAYLVLHMLSIKIVVIGCALGLMGRIYPLYALYVYSTKIILNIYFWSCIYSFYKGLQSGYIHSTAYSIFPFCIDC